MLYSPLQTKKKQKAKTVFVYQEISGDSNLVAQLYHV